MKNEIKPEEYSKMDKTIEVEYDLGKDKFNKIYFKSLDKSFTLEEIETALKRLDELDTWINHSNTTKIKALNKKLKALEIIKEKRVDVSFFDTYVKWNWEKYQNRKLKCSDIELTQEEFDLLKEVLL